MSAVTSQIAYTTPAAATAAAPASSTVVMPSVQMAAPVQMTAAPVQMTAAPVQMTAAPVQMPTPTYMYSAGSAQVPVYGASTAVPQFYQQPALAMPTVSYQQSQPFTQEQLKTIFPMGAPSASTFQPFTQQQYQYNIVDSTSAFAPAAVPATSTVMTAPAASEVVELVPGASTTVPETASTMTPATTAAATTASATTEVSSGKKSSKKASSSKKLSSKKKQKGCC